MALRRGKVFLVMFVLISSVIVGPGTAAGRHETKHSRLKALEERVSRLEAENASQRQQIEGLTTRVQALESLLGSGTFKPPNPPPGVVVDQMQTRTNGGLGVSFFAPVGQQFVPTKGGLVAIYFPLAFGASDANQVLAPEVVVNVHQGSDLAGSIVATSTIPIEIPPFPLFSSEWVGATFQPLVHLTSGQPYAVELQVSGGSANVGFDWLYGEGADSYQGGCALLSGAEDCAIDFGFVTWASDGTTSAPLTQGGASGEPS